MKERTFTKGSGRIVLFLSVLILTLGLFISLGAQKTYAATDFNGMDWEITSGGVLQLGRAGTDQTLTMSGTVTENTWPWKSEALNVKSVKFVGNVKAKGSLRGMFCFMQNASQFTNLNYLDVSEATSMMMLFDDCRSVKTLNLSGWDTSKVSSMEAMFRRTHSLQELTFGSSFSTENATSLNSMFRETGSLKSLDLSGFNVERVSNFHSLFYKSGLVALDLSSWKTPAAITMSMVFDSCYYLKEIKLGAGWDVSKVTTFYYMFNGCKALESIDTSGWKADSLVGVTDGDALHSMFRGCEKLKEIDVSGFNTSKVKRFDEMFRSCYALERIIGLDNFDTGNATSMASMFRGCKGLEELDISSFDTGNVESFAYTFASCEALKEIKGIEKLDTSSCKNFGWMFAWDYALEKLNVESFNTSNAVDMSAMFAHCKLLQNIPGVENFDTSKVGTSKVNNTDNTPGFHAMFNGCEGLTKLNLSKWDTSNSEYFSQLFLNCINLESADISNFKMGQAKSIAQMFSGCEKLQTIKLPKNRNDYKMAEVTDIQDLMRGCEVLPEETIQAIASAIYTENVTNMKDVFGSNKQLVNLDVSHWKTSKPSVLDNMQGLFSYCENLKNLQLPTGLDTSNATNLGGVFRGCMALESLDVSWMDTSSAETLGYLFGDMASLKELKGYEDFDLGSCTNLSNVFRNTRLETIDVSDWDTPLVKNMSMMFAHSVNLEEIKGLDKLEYDSVTEMKGMFEGCTALNKAEISKMNTSGVEDMTNMFKGAESLADDKILDLDMSSVKEDLARDMLANAKGLRNILKAQIGANYADSFPSPLKEQIKEAAAKIDNAFTPGSKTTPAEIKEMVNAAKSAIAAASAQIPASVDSALTDAANKNQIAEAEEAKDKTSDATKAAAAAAKEAADKAKALADAAKAMADAALAKDPSNPTLQAAAKAAADNAAKAANAQAAAQARYDRIVNNPQPPVVVPQVGERFVVADLTYEVLTVPASGNCSATLVKANNAKTVVVPETVAYKNRTFEVNEINTKAFYKNTKKVTLGANVDTIDKQAFKGSKVKTVILKTKDLTKKGVKGSLKGSKVTTVKVKVGAKKANQKFVKKYKKIFTQKIAGKKVTVK